MTGKKMKFRSVAAAGLCLLAASAVQARAADQLPFAFGRWTLSQDEQVSPEALTKLCANPLAWMDITAETYATGGSATDAQTCLAPRWRRSMRRPSRAPRGSAIRLSIPWETRWTAARCRYLREHGVGQQQLHDLLRAGRGAAVNALTIKRRREPRSPASLA